MFCTGLSRSRDVAVLGTGPAGLAIAAELASGGATVTCIAPSPVAPWAPTYGVWLDDLNEVVAAACVRHRWQSPLVQLDDRRRVALDRTYARIDNASLQRHLTERLESGGGLVRVGRAERVEHRDELSRVHLGDGSHVDARVVIDATGLTSHFVRRPARRCAFQSAYGELVRVKRHDFRAGEMALMDLRGEDDLPTFLYAMPWSEEVLFVEETSLVGRPPMNHMTLRSRLHARLARMGLEVREVVGREVCLIPMGYGVPYAQRIIAYGGAGAFVHPATGYQIARALRLAKPTADAILDGLGRGGPTDAARAAYATMWPARDRRAWELFTFGMEVMRDLDAAGLRSFLSAFFSLPLTSWSRYMSGTSTPSEVVSAMARVFAASSSSERWSLLSAITGGRSKPLWRALRAGGGQ